MMAVMDGTKINGGRIRSPENFFHFGCAGVWREREACRFAVGMSESGLNESLTFEVIFCRGTRQAEDQHPPACLEPNYLLLSDSFAACTSELAKLSTFLSTINAVTASLSAC
jgi:hypothetical protein